MVQEQVAVLKPETMIEEFEKNGVTHPNCTKATNSFKEIFVPKR